MADKKKKSKHDEAAEGLMSAGAIYGGMSWRYEVEEKNKSKKHEREAQRASDEASYHRVMSESTRSRSKYADEDYQYYKDKRIKTDPEKTPHGYITVRDREMHYRDKRDSLRRQSQQHLTDMSNQHATERVNRGYAFDAKREAKFWNKNKKAGAAVAAAGLVYAGANTYRDNKAGNNFTTYKAKRGQKIVNIKRRSKNSRKDHLENRKF